MKVAVTGAGGFVGRAIVAHLLQAGVPVVAVSHRPTTPAGAETRRLPSPDEPDAAFAAVLDGVTHVVHGAGLTNASPDTPESAYMSANAQLTARLAWAARQGDIRRFVFLSSIRAVVGAGYDGTITAQMPEAPADAYGRSKLAAEHEAAAAFADRPDRLTILRLAPVYGVGMSGNLERLLRLADRSLPLPLGGIKGARTLVAVEAVAELVHAVLTAAGPLRPHYLVGDREPAALPDIITAFRQGLGRPRRLVAVPRPLLAAMASAAGRRELFRALDVSQICDTAVLSEGRLPQRAESLSGLRDVAQARLSGAGTRS